MFYSALESGNHVIVIVATDWSLLFVRVVFIIRVYIYYKLFKLFKLFVIMNWKDDQIEKLILFYSHNSLFVVPDFWYRKSCNWCQILVPVFWYQFLVSMSWALPNWNRKSLTLKVFPASLTLMPASSGRCVS